MIDIKLWRLMKASKALIEKMDEITNSEEWQAMLFSAKLVGFVYDGNDWADEYEALKYEIETIERT